MTQSLGAHLGQAQGRPSGFDYLRIVLSVGVVMVHAVLHTKGPAFEHLYVYGTPVLGGAVTAILPMFFALSGFLVAGSLQRCATLISFLGLRVLRIYPALGVEVLLTALLVAPFVVDSAPWAYFTGPEFQRYLLNATGHADPFLPGSFATNPVPGLANVQLWTVPYELFCYIALALIALLGLKKNRRLALWGTAGLGLLMTASAGLLHGGDLPTGWGALNGAFLVLAFLIGVCLYLYKDAVPVSGAAIAGAVAALIVGFPGGFFGDMLGTVAAAYLAAALGVLNPPRVWVLRHADLSYGIFLYHGIVQQLIIYALPEVPGWATCFALSLAASALVAAASWSLVERPVLARKSVCFALESALLAALRRRGHLRQTPL